MMDESYKLAAGLWGLLDARTPFSVGDPEQRVAVWDLLPQVKAAALGRYLRSPLYERPALYRDLIKANRLCGEAAALLKAAADPMTPDRALAQPEQVVAGPPGTPPGGQLPGEQAESHVDTVATMIAQAQARGSQITPAEIANTLQQAGQQDLQEMMATIQQQIDEHVAMYIQQFSTPPPMPGQPGVMPAPPMPIQAQAGPQPPIQQQQQSLPPKTANQIALGLRGR